MQYGSGCYTYGIRILSVLKEERTHFSNLVTILSPYHAHINTCMYVRIRLSGVIHTSIAYCIWVNFSGALKNILDLRERGCNIYSCVRGVWM